MNTDDKTKKSRNGTRLNKAFRNGLGINSRKYGCGRPVENSLRIENGCFPVFGYVDQEVKDGGNVTPFNIQCNCDGACAIRKIIVDQDETIVLFQDGDRVQLHRHPSDTNDLVTAVLWALGQKVFGTELARQINRAIKYRAHTIEELREAKSVRKTVDDALKPVNG